MGVIYYTCLYDFVVVCEIITLYTNTNLMHSIAIILQNHSVKSILTCVIC